MSKNLQEFEDFSIEQADEDKKSLKTGKFMKLQVGQNLIRFMPARAGEKAFRIYWRHFIEKADGQMFSFACPSRTKPITGPCPVCAHASKIESNSGKAAAKKYFPGRRIVANVIDRNDEEVGPKLLEMPMQVYEQLIELRKNLGDDGNFTNPTEGFDIIISRTGSGQMDTSYTVTGARKSTPLAGDESTWRNWLKEQTDTAYYILPKTEEEIRGMLMGETKPAGNKQLKAAAAVVEPEEIEAEDAEFSDDFED